MHSSHVHVHMHVHVHAGKCVQACESVHVHGLPARLPMAASRAARAGHATHSCMCMCMCMQRCPCTAGHVHGAKRQVYELQACMARPLSRRRSRIVRSMHLLVHKPALSASQALACQRTSFCTAQHSHGMSVGNSL